MTTDADLYEQLLNGNDQAVFAYGGIISKDMGLVISNETTQTSPEASISFQNIPRSSCPHFAVAEGGRSLS